MADSLLRRRPVEVVVGLLALFLVVAGTTRVVVESGGSDPAPAVAAPPSSSMSPSASPTLPPTSPSPVLATSLGAAVPQLIGFVQSHRGLAFRQPVRVRVLPAATFVRVLRASDRRLSVAEPRPGSRLYEARFATLLSLGVVRSRKEVEQYYARVAADTRPRAFYDLATKRLYVRGGPATPLLQRALVEELTTALLDQVFDLNRPQLAGDFEAALVFRTLWEGDAERLGQAWAKAQTAAVQQRISREQELFGDASGSPDALSVLASYPFLAGPQLVQALLARGGQARLDAALRRPPTTTEQVLDPSLRAPGRVPVPRRPGGTQALRTGVIGELGLVQVLQDYPLDPGAAKFWRGDRFVTYATGGQFCTLVNVRTSTRKEQVLLTRAARAAQGVDSAVRVGQTSVLLRGCHSR